MIRLAGTRPIAYALAVALVAAVVAGCGASTGPGSTSTTTPAASHAADRSTVQGTEVAVAPLPATGSSGAQSGSGQSGSSGSAPASIAYPYPAYGSLGVAPEGTILAAGTGQARMKADGSDRAAAQDKAVTAALAQAKSQASSVARSMGVQLGAIYSTSVSVSESPVYPTLECVPPVAPGIEKPNATPAGSQAVTGDGGSASGGTVTGGTSTGGAGQGAPAVDCLSSKPTPQATELVAMVVVAFKVS